MLSTLLYTWSNYEMVYTAANTYVSSTGSTLRAVFVIITALCTIIATAIYDYFTAMSVWYALHFTIKFLGLNLTLINIIASFKPDFAFPCMSAVIQFS
jgi:hypothetical protein